MRISLCINAMENIPKAKEAGFEAFEFSGVKLASYTEDEFLRMLEIMKQTGIPCAGINAYADGRPAIIGPEFSPEETACYAREVCSRAARMGAPAIGIGAPKSRILPEGFPRETADLQIRRFLRITAEEAAAFGMNVLLEALQKNACNYLNDTREAAALAEELALDNLKLVFDFYHSVMQGEDAAAEFRKYSGQIVHVHFSTAEGTTGRGFPVRRDQDQYLSYFQALKEGGYQNAVSVEPGAFDPELAAESAAMLKHCRDTVCC